MSPDASDQSPSPDPGAEHDEANMSEVKDARASSEENSPTRDGSAAKPTTKTNAKDPSRPRRKKARRACFACQRAHLTCGDERPCLRCIKRGLQDQCHDGVRKKAKYLHDTPAEALLPGYANNYTNGPQGLSNVSGASVSNAAPQAGNYLPPNLANNYQYGSDMPQTQMNGALMDRADVMPDYPNPQSMANQPYPTPTAQQMSPAQNLSNPIGQASAMGAGGTQSYENALVDPSDHNMFNFNLSELNFGNHYGALEFGMLGHLSSGAINAPDLDSMNSINPHGHGGLQYDGAGNYSAGFGYNQSFASWQQPPHPSSRQNSTNALWGHEPPSDAYAIGEHPPSLTGASPHSQNQDHPGYQSAPSPETPYPHVDQNQPQSLMRQSLSQAQHHHRKQPLFPGHAESTGQQKPKRDPSEIYKAVTAPYSYTQGFHALTAFLQKRFPTNKVLRIAKALANIRPSFISCNKNLNHDDLILMEKCFQRTLFEYEDFFLRTGTPSIICRRTGEVVAASKEFCMVTGWRRDILLGKEPNLNVNTGGSSGASGTQTGASSRGAATPRIPNVEIDPGRPQPVFLAELLDEDSVVKFYEDFAALAFGASHPSRVGLACSLLKYRTKDGSDWGSNGHDSGSHTQSLSNSKPDATLRGAAGIKALGERDGQVPCSMAWMIKRDTFDIPMLIVLNFLPII